MTRKITEKPPLYWYGLFWIPSGCGVIGPYHNYNICCKGLQEYKLDDSIPIEFPSLNIHTVSKYLRDNGF